MHWVCRTDVLADPDWAMAAILVVIVWKYFGFHMMLFIAGLQGIDQALLDAAAIDGASRLQRFRHITLPLLVPTIRLSVFFSVIGSLQLFDMIMPLTKGGPADSTQTPRYVPVYLRHHAHAGGLRQCGGRGAVRDLRDLRLQL